MEPSSPYRDSPPPSPSQPAPQTTEPQPSSSPEDSSIPSTPTTPTVTKPLPPLPPSSQPPHYDTHYPPPRPLTPYMDDPTEPPFHPYTDSTSDSTPLVYLLPVDAPPSYNVAVQQSFRDTLISHIPSEDGRDWRQDEESRLAMLMRGEDGEREVNQHAHQIERMVAYLIVGVSLLVVGVGTVWWVLGSEFVGGAFGH